MNPLLPWLGALALALVVGPPALRRARLSRAKHRSLAGHPRIAKRLARLVPGYALCARRFFAADGAPDAIADRRRDRKSVV